MSISTVTNSVRIYPDDVLAPLNLDEYFDPRIPLAIDLGCGKGRFLLVHAAEHPDVNFLGIDRMLRRVRKVDRKIVRSGLSNVRLLRMEAYYAVSYLIPPELVTTYFILFPDPWPKAKHHDHRLFNPRFVESLHRTLRPEGQVHLATDHLPYFEEIVGIMGQYDHLFETVTAWEPAPHERTDFELLFIDSKPIGRASFRRRSD